MTSAFGAWLDPVADKLLMLFCSRVVFRWRDAAHCWWWWWCVIWRLCGGMVVDQLLAAAPSSPLFIEALT
jgi:phosphatidylglycerophosphate synthase